MNFWLLFWHILGACIWVGGHLYLCLCILPKAVRHQDSQPILNFENSFEKLGMTALVVQVLTGFYMAHKYLPSFSMLTDYHNQISVLISMKITWLIFTILTALSAQLIVIPKLKKDLGNAKLRHIFAGHIILVTVLGLAFMTTGVLFRTGF